MWEREERLIKRARSAGRGAVWAENKHVERSRPPHSAVDELSKYGGGTATARQADSKTLSSDLQSAMVMNFRCLKT